MAEIALVQVLCRISRQQHRSNGIEIENRVSGALLKQDVRRLSQHRRLSTTHRSGEHDNVDRHLDGERNLAGFTQEQRA